MRTVAVGDIWMWEPISQYRNIQKEYWLISKQDADGEWWAIGLSAGPDNGQELDITINDLSVNWTKVA